MCYYFERKYIKLTTFGSYFPWVNFTPNISKFCEMAQSNPEIFAKNENICNTLYSKTICNKMTVIHYKDQIHILTDGSQSLFSEKINVRPKVRDDQRFLIIWNICEKIEGISNYCSLIKKRIWIFDNFSISRHGNFVLNRLI
jgi:hypothetical protein